MTTRDTSAEAYRTICDSGLLGLVHKHVYSTVYRHGPMTANEAFEEMRRMLVHRYRHDSNTHARFTELRDMGCLKEVGTRPCNITGRRAILWSSGSTWMSPTCACACRRQSRTAPGPYPWI